MCVRRAVIRNPIEIPTEGFDYVTLNLAVGRMVFACGRSLPLGAHRIPGFPWNSFWTF